MPVGKDLGFFAALRMTLIRGLVTNCAKVSLRRNGGKEEYLPNGVGDTNTYKE